MELINKVQSKIDKTIKYVFKTHDGLIMETTYIDNNTGKDIICVSCQSMCAQGCKFCHLTDYVGWLKLRNFEYREINESVDYIYGDLNLKDNNRTLLISYMGCGEPLANADNVSDSMILLNGEYSNIRFGMATSLPKTKWKEFFQLIQVVKDMKIPLKVHLSLHYTNDEVRRQWMPNALDIKPALSAMSFYKEITGNAVEIHYAMIAGVNDSIVDIGWLNYFLRDRGFNIKFLRYNEKESLDEKPSELDTCKEFKLNMFLNGIDSEIYEAPGKDVGASCGQFLFDEYNIKKDE